MDEKLVTVAQFADYIEANLAKQILEEAGIKVLISDENSSTLFPPGISSVELQVFESQAQQATEILASAESLDEQDDDELDEPEDEMEDELEEDE
jgi:hypothetical protein